MTGYLLVGAVVAVVMSVGAWLVRTVDGRGEAVAVICGAIAVSVTAWMALAELLQLGESTPAAMAIMIMMMALTIVAVRQHRTDWN